MSIPMDLDRRFRDAATRSGMLDAGYDLVETPLGELLVAATDRGLLRISFDPDPDAELDRIERLAGRRVLRSSASVDNVHRELDEYFEGRRHAFDLAVDLRGLTPFSERVLHELARVPFGETQRLRVTASFNPDRSLRDRRSGWRSHDREHVLIAVRVDTNHVIQFVCKHPDRSSTRTVRYAGLEQGNRAAGL